MGLFKRGVETTPIHAALCGGQCNQAYAVKIMRLVRLEKTSLVGPHADHDIEMRRMCPSCVRALLRTRRRFWPWV